MKADGSVSNGSQGDPMVGAFLDIDTMLKALGNLWDMVVLSDLEGNLLYVNDSVKDVLGYEPDEYISGHKLGGIAHPDDMDWIREAFEGLVTRTGNTANVKVRVKHRDGHYLWMESRCVNLTDSRRGLLIYIIRDISREKENEDRILKEEAKMRAILENTDDMIALRDAEGRLVASNASWREIASKIFKDPVEEGTRTTDLLPKRWKQHWEQIIKNKVLKGSSHREQFDYPIEGKTRRFDIMFKPVIRDEKVIGFTEFNREITETWKDHQRFKSYIDRTPGIYYSFSTEEGASYWSPRVKDVLGFDLGDLEKDPFLWSGSVHEDDRELVRDAIEEGKKKGHFDIEYRIKDRKGNWHVLWDRSLMISTNGNEVIIEGMATDVTDQKRMTEELRENKKFIENVASSFPGMIYRFSLSLEGEMRIDYISRNTEDFFERPRKALISSPIPMEDIHPDDRDEFIASVKRSAKELTDWDHEFRLIPPRSGRMKWVRGLSTPHREPDGTTIWNGAIFDISRTKQLEEDLKASKFRLEKLIEDIPDGVFVHDMDGNILTVNREASRTLGYDHDEMLRKKIWEFDPNIKDQDHPKRYWQKLSRDNSVTIDTHHRRKDGTVFPVEVKLSMNRIKGKKAIIAMARDISERKVMERRFSSFIDSTEDLFMLKDGDLKHIIVNRAYLDFLDMEESDVLGKNDMELLPGSLADQCMSSDMVVKEDPRLHVFEESSSDGRFFETRKFPVPLGQGEVGVGAIIRDITDKRKAEMALEESRRQIEALMSNIPGMVYRCKNEPDWPMTFVSEGSMELLGISADRFLGEEKSSYNDFVHPEDREKIWEIVQSAIDEKEPFSMEYRLFDINGKQKWVLEKGSAIFDEKGGVRFLEGIITDISNLKRAEQRIKEEKSRAEFYLDLLGHDIGNLHQGILTGLEIANRSDDPDTVNMGMVSSEGLLRKSLLMVKQVQLLARMRYRDPEPKRMVISDLIRGYDEKFSSLFPDRDIDLRFDLPQECCSINAEPMIEALFFNLFHNAIKFHDGKHAIVEMSVKERPDDLLITISDHGRGIPDDLKEKVFGRFEMFGQKGRVGLGLSLVKFLVERYKGSIEIMDRVRGDHRKGAKFVLTFPRSE